MSKRSRVADEQRSVLGWSPAAATAAANMATPAGDGNESDGSLTAPLLKKSFGDNLAAAVVDVEANGNHVAVHDDTSAADEDDNYDIIQIIPDGAADNLAAAAVVNVEANGVAHNGDVDDSIRIIHDAADGDDSIRIIHDAADGDDIESGRHTGDDDSRSPPPALTRNGTPTASQQAVLGAVVAKIESLDYEINEGELFKQDWRRRSDGEVLQYTVTKWILAFLVGLTMGLVASFINIAVENIGGLKLLHVAQLVQAKRYLAGFAVFTGSNLALTAAAAWMCVEFAPTAAGPGVPEIKAFLNGVDTPDMFGLNVFLAKTLGSICVVAANLDLGKEGPMIHIGTCLANLLNKGFAGDGEAGARRRWKCLQQFDNDRDLRDLITIGSSAGVCAAFRSPVGGVLFAMEEVATWWRSALLWRDFFSTAVVVVVLRAFLELCSGGKCGMFGAGGLIIFDVGDVTVHYHINDLLPVTLVGVAGGLLGALYNAGLIRVLRLYQLINIKGKLPRVMLSLAVCLITSVSLYWLPFLAPCRPCSPYAGAAACPTLREAGNFKQFNCPPGHYNDLASLLLATNVDAATNVFKGNPSEFLPSSLAVFFLTYCVLGYITFGIATPTGLFLPIILMGSGYARLLIYPLAGYVRMNQGLYAVLGAAAFMSGSMRMTVSVCVIFLELTNNLLLLPIMMFVLLIAKSVGDSINPSIYELILELKGLPFLEDKPEPWMRNLTVGELAAEKQRVQGVVSLRAIEKVSKIVSVLRGTVHNGFPVVDKLAGAGEVTELHGLVLRSHLVAALEKRWFQPERRRRGDQEAGGVFTPAELARKWGRVEDVELSSSDMEMWMDLGPITNTTPYTVVETMSVAKAVILFRRVELRHMLVIPKYQGAGVPPVKGILTRQDLRAQHILEHHRHLAEKSKRA